MNKKEKRKAEIDDLRFNIKVLSNDIYDMSFAKDYLEALRFNMQTTEKKFQSSILLIFK